MGVMVGFIWGGWWAKHAQAEVLVRGRSNTWFLSKKIKTGVCGLVSALSWARSGRLPCHCCLGPYSGHAKWGRFQVGKFDIVIGGLSEIKTRVIGE